MSRYRLSFIFLICLSSVAFAQGPASNGAFGNALELDGIDGYAWMAPNASGASEGIKLYVDGEAAGTNLYTGGSSAYALELMGSSAWGGYFQGAVDDLRIWNYARSQSEIQSSMDEPLGAWASCRWRVSRGRR